MAHATLFDRSRAPSPMRGDAGWPFCPSCTYCDTDYCDDCDGGDLFEAVDGAEEGSARPRRRVIPLEPA